VCVESVLFEEEELAAGDTFAGAMKLTQK